VSEEILINSTPSEARVALVENGMLQEVWLERASHTGYIGNIYKGVVSRVLPGLQAAFIDIGLERTAFLHARDMVRHDPLTTNNETPPEPLISSLLRPGDQLMVQVIKDPLGSKGARLTTNISVPSRFLVLLPECDVVGVSARIEEESERARLKALVHTLRDHGLGHGYIVRTNAEGVNDFALSADMAYLGKVWQSVKERHASAPPATRVFEDLSLPLRALRDMMHEKVDRVRIDSPEVLERARDFARSFVPEWLDRIEEYSGDRPIFDLFGVEDEIDSALRPTVPLKSGGYLVFDQTESMTTIDVNTGGYVGHRNLEETIYKTNLEAAQAIARQLRLRNLGGIIIIDFIDMLDEEHRRQVMRSFERALERDHVETGVPDHREPRASPVRALPAVRGPRHHQEHRDGLPGDLPRDHAFQQAVRRRHADGRGLPAGRGAYTGRTVRDRCGTGGADRQVHPLPAGGAVHPGTVRRSTALKSLRLRACIRE
jgi:ribonuclease G